jgi:hypothetical protein
LEKEEKINWPAIGYFTFSTLWIIEGIIFIIEDRVIIGLHRDSNLNVVGGWLIAGVGIIFLYVSYHSLSPFGKIRSFLEETSKRKNKNKD